MSEGDSIKEAAERLENRVEDLDLRVDAVEMSVAGNAEESLDIDEEMRVADELGTRIDQRTDGEAVEESYAMPPFTVFYEHYPEDSGREVGFYIFVPKGCLRVDGEEVDFADAGNEIDADGCIAMPDVSKDDTEQKIYAHVRAVVGRSGDGGAEGDELKIDVRFNTEKDYDEWEWEPGERRFDFVVGEFDEKSYTRICTSMVKLGEVRREVAFSVEGRNNTWKVRYFDGSFTYAGFTPDEVTPTPVEGWIDLNSRAKNLSVYGHATYEVDKDGDVVSCKRLVINTSSTAPDSSSSSSSSSSGGSDTTDAVFTFHIADITGGVVSQDALGAIHAGGNGGNIDVDVDEISVDYQATVPVSEGSGESASAESKVLEVKGWSSASATSGTSIAAQLGLPVQSGLSSREVVVRNGVGGSLEYVEVGEVDMNALVDSVADEVDSRIGDGTLTIMQQGSESPLGTFTANQATNTSVTIPAPVTPNDGVLSITVGNNSPVTFTANQATNASVTIPEGVALTDTDPSDVVLSTGTASAGSSDKAARADHVHKLPSTVKIKQSPVADPSASGTATAFIDSITQNANGEITVTKKNVDIPAAQVQSDWSVTDSTSKAFIKNKPTIPAAQVNANWNATSGVAQILNKPTLAAVATSGSYNDLTNKPAMMTGSVTVVTNIYWYGDALYFTTSTIDFDNKTIRANGGTKLADTVTHQSEHT